MKYQVYMYHDYNLGDDLFLEALVQNNPRDIFYISLPKDYDLTPQLKRYQNIKINNIRLRELLVKKSIDGIIHIGGSIFQDLSIKLYKGYFLRALITKALRYKKIKTYFIGFNLGPFKTKFGKYLFKMALNNAQYSCTRDKMSYDLMKKWKIKSQFNVAPDVVFTHKEYEVEEKGILGISILNYYYGVLDEQENYEEKMSILIKKYLKNNPQKRVRLFGYCGGNENDGQAIDKIILKLDNQEKTKVEKVVYSSQTVIDDFLKKYLESEYLICNRFHSLILALKHKKPFFPIIYSNKTLNYLNDLKYSGGRIINYGKITEDDVNFLLKKIEKSEKEINVSNEYIKSSFKHFSFIKNNEGNN